MKKQTNRTPTRSSFTLLRQLCDLIPTHLVPKLARDTGVEEQSHPFTPWGHVVSLIFAQLTHALGLNDVCDALRLNSGPLSAIRGANGPSKNGFSTANRERPAQMAQDLFWAILEHLQNLHPGFGGRRRPQFAFRFKRAIHLVDATTIQRIARCMDWAKHRRRKAAAQCHLRLDLQTFLPRCAIVGTAGEHDSLRARELCAGGRAGEIVIFDKAYLDFTHRADLALRGVTGPQPPAFPGFEPDHLAFGLDGTNGAVSVPALGLSNDTLTITCWIKPANVLQASYCGLVFARGGTPNTVAGLHYDDANMLRHSWNDQYWWRSSGLKPATNQWNFVALVVEPDQATIYLDDGSGLQSWVDDEPHGVQTFNTSLWLGQDPLGRYYQGALDEVTLFNRALSRSEIWQLSRVARDRHLQLSYEIGSLVQDSKPSGPPRDGVGLGAT